MQVVGVDFCGRFLDAAVKIQRGEEVRYGPDDTVVRLPSVAGLHLKKVDFKQVRETFDRHGLTTLHCDSRYVCEL